MARQTLAQEITQYLTEQGAVRVGFADLHGVTGAALPYGITALVALPREIVGPLADQPHRAYYDAYQAINVRLDAMAEGCAALLRAYDRKTDIDSDGLHYKFELRIFVEKPEDAVKMQTLSIDQKVDK